MSTTALITLSLQQFWRELKNTDLRLFLISLFLVMASVTTIQLFTSRVNLALVRQGSHFLAADQMVRQPMPVPKEWYNKAAEVGVETSGYTLFTSMLAHGEELALTGVKAVQPGYPLRGELKVSPTQDGTEQVIRAIPQPGNIWLEPALARRLGVQPGDDIEFGATQLRFNRYIRYEPDRNATFFAFIPRALVHRDDLEKAGVLVRGSRVIHTFLYASDNTEQVRAMFDWLEEEIPDNARAIDPRDDNEGIGRTLGRAEDFLVLAGLLVTLLCGIGIALAAQRYTLLRSRHIAVYKTLGMTSYQIQVLMSVQLLGMLLLAWLVASLVGWGLQHMLAELASAMFKVRLPSAFSPLIFFDSLFTGLVAVLAFAVPDFLRLGKIPAMHILRASNTDLNKRYAFVPGVLGMLVLSLLYSNSLLLSAALFGGIVFCWLLASVVTRMIIASGSHGDNFWSLLLARMRKRKMHYGLQTVVFSLCIVFGLMLVLVRGSLLENWRSQTPEDAVNKMLVNIAPEQQPVIASLLQDAGIEQEDYYPIIRGRFVRINGVDVKEIVEKSGTKENEHKRDLALTFRVDLPEDNDLIDGEWWSEQSIHTTREEGEKARISVEKFLADNYQLEVGDVMVFRIGASEIEARISSIRDVDWGSFSPNFYIMFEPGWLEEYPFTYMTGVHIPKEREDVENTLVRTFGNVSVFSADILLERIRTLIEQVSKAIEAILYLLLVAGTVVVISGVRSTLDERLHECALMRTFGASQNQIMRLVIVEFALLGGISGLLGAVGAEAISWYLHKQIFELDYIWTPYIWLFGPLAGIVLIGVTGVVSCLPAVRQPPIVLLRTILQ